MPRTDFCRRDALACGAVLVCALVLMLLLARGAGAENAQVTVSQNGETVWQVHLAGTESTFAVAGDYPLTVAVSGGKVWIAESTCPGGDCVARGTISRPGESIVCLPARVTVSITGGSGSADVIVG